MAECLPGKVDSNPCVMRSIDGDIFGENRKIRVGIRCGRSFRVFLQPSYGAVWIEDDVKELVGIHGSGICDGEKQETEDDEGE